MTEDPDFDKEQLKRFLDVCGRAEKKGISLGKKHAASSDGLFPGPEFYLDMVRPGITLYGYYPNSETQKEDSLGLRPALQLFAYVTFIKELAPGESLSYHRAFKAQKKMRVATLGIGYSDGFPAQVPDKGLVSIGNKKYKIMAALTANHLMIDLDNDASVKLGDRGFFDQQPKRFRPDGRYRRRKGRNIRLQASHLPQSVIAEKLSVSREQ